MSTVMRALAIALLLVPRAAAADPSHPSPPAMRPLLQPSNRPKAAGPAKFVDAKRGDDTGDGSVHKPWKTLGAAANKLAPGDTLYLHGGVYYETVALTLAGTATAPITIRSAPGELAILDGGLRAPAESPRTAWEPVPGGASGEYRSTASHPIGKQDSERGVWVTGNFADSMVPLHGYKFDVDLRADNQFWTVENTTAGSGVYVGPGVWLDRASGRIHIRLAHTRLKSQTNYRGPTDPRTVPLVIAVDRPALRITGSQHLRLEDLVLRGSARHALEIHDTKHITLDGLTIYGGDTALYVKSTANLTLVRSRLRGTAAPWSSRASMKYRGSSPYLLVAAKQLPQSRDWELAYNDFVDGHDGLIVDTIKSLRFHHNRLDNLNDDGVFLTFPPRDALPDDIHIFENVFTRVYTALAFAQDAKGGNPIGSGVYVFRNVFDLRDGTYGRIARDPAADDKPPQLLAGRVVGDHGSPTWEPLFFYNNTVVTAENTWRGYYGALVGVMGTAATKRRVFNNIFVQLAGNPGLSFQGTDADDVQVDGNLMWSVKDGPAVQGDYFSSIRVPRAAKSRGANDRFGDPRFVDLATGDVRLAANSAAIDAGSAVPATWPDPLRKLDKGKPDIGALPAGAPPLRVGPAARP